MFSKLSWYYINSRVPEIVGVIAGVPSTLLAVAEGNWLSLAIGIALGFGGFLWAVYKFPIEAMLKNARETFAENLRLKDTNAKLSQEKETLGVQLAHAKETLKQLGVEDK